MDAFASLAERDQEKASFAVVYTFEAHPEENSDQSTRETPVIGGVEQRILDARALKEAHGLTIPVYADPLDVEFGKHFEFAHWSYLVVSKSGEILQYGPDGLGGSTTDALDAFLKELDQPE